MRLLFTDRTKLLPAEARQFARRRVLFALSRFDSRIERVRVVIDPVTLRGGMEIACRVVVKLRKLSDVIVSVDDADVYACLARAADRAGRAVVRLIEQEQRFDRERPLAASRI